MTDRAHIRWMIRRDMPEVLGIEDESFEFPWLAEDFICCMRQRNCVVNVVEHEDQIVGYMVYEPHKDRIHLLNLAVAPSHRRRGIGRQMIAKVAGKLSPNRRRLLVLETCETNLDAQLFFRANRFRAIAVVRGFYDNGETAYRFGLPVGAVRGPCCLEAVR